MDEGTDKVTNRRINTWMEGRPDKRPDGLTGGQMENGCMANERGLWTDEREK